ncbi:MAG: hypothetical protein HYT12_02300 [Candidatus Liptonbacteria bacterium]|nr:hypothetical protein [Candidatus Liptonbacteria bacterium]
MHNLNKKIIGLDLDGVILDHTKTKIELAGQYGLTIDPSETPSDIMETKIEPALYQALQAKLYSDHALSLKTPLMRGAKEGLHYIKSLGIPYYLISRRREPEYAMISLKFHDLWPQYFDPTNTFFVKEKKDKDIKAKELHVTHFIDDEPSVIQELISVPQKYLFDPFCVYTKAPAESKRVHSWEEFLQQF